MPKRVIKSSNSKLPKKSTSKKLDAQIAENLVELQKVHTNLLEKIDNLTNQLSTLLSLFEMAARSFAKNSSVKSSEKDTEFLEKIDKLLDQNKTIARGLTIMEEKVRERMYPENNPPPQVSQQSGRPLPRF
jgi:hypothetical protein